MNIDDLKTLLLKYNIDLEKWSHTQGTKNIEDLKNEIDAGETILEIIDNQLVRVTRIASIKVKVKIGEKMFTLVEDQQIFFTGAVRKRGLSNLAEKIRRGETPEFAAYRALKEEIGLHTTKKFEQLEETAKNNHSPSYPGLNSVYKTFNYQITLNELDLEFMRFTEYQKKKGKITFFTLKPD
ncbi:MAG: NUDIX domain-containing protein [Gomphosphaeria aponina SAG 52.96 = DSM 107014]|uniref:NUDIX domain-containing protein n=1 Tax=Gomphosphaeria aponina SAG 52.96 = DSM 107014 TaxID=1521640 RepID=A0A941GTC3_9CHRO|nr:NUDIX domain-containing protein [Gomphosphaeria aponina SAG 52.96 = DSM 107014]